jgi:glycosyltransferase 2 family protein
VKRIVRGLIVAMLLAVPVYGALVWYRGASKVGDRLETFAWSTFGIACALAFSNYMLRFLKWEYYLRVLEIRGIPKGESLLTFLAGFVLTVTPGKVGEVFKSLILFQTRGVPVVRTAPIVVAERVTDLIGVIVIIALGSLSFQGGEIWALAGAIVVLALLVFVTSHRLSSAFVTALPRLPSVLGRLGAKIAPKVAEALGGVRDLTTPRRLLWPTLLSIGAWSLEGLGLWVILRGFGERASVSITAFCYATATLAGALVPVPGGLGVTEKLLEEQLARLGSVDTTTATAGMLLIRFATLWFGVAIGFLSLAILRAKYPGLGGDVPPPEVRTEPAAVPAIAPEAVGSGRGSTK